MCDFKANGTVPPDVVDRALSMITPVRRRDLRSSQGENMIIKILFTIVFGFVWWWAYTFVGSSLTFLVILGSILAVCACCCSGGKPSYWFEFNSKNFIACIRRCLPATFLLIIGLLILGVIVVWYTGGNLIGMWLQILIAAILPPLCVRVICCAYES